MTPLEALQLIATPMRADGTWNRDREACRLLAVEALAQPATGHGLTDQAIEAAVQKAGGRWNGSWWVFEDADLHPFVRSLLARAQPAAEPDERAAFEVSMTHLVGPSLFDALGEFWFDRLDDGRYEFSRMQDAWLGWQARAMKAKL